MHWLKRSGGGLFPTTQDILQQETGSGVCAFFTKRQGIRNRSEASTKDGSIHTIQSSRNRLFSRRDHQRDMVSRFTQTRALSGRHLNILLK